MAVGPTRRELITWLVGAPAAAALAQAGCGRRRGPALPDGELLTPGKAAGHRLRDATAAGAAGPAGANVRVPDDRWQATTVVVIGAGVAGLAAAWWLRRRGVHDVAVVELDDAPGGTARSGHGEVTAYPWGAHYVVAPMGHQVALRALLAEAGALERDGDRDGERGPVVDERMRCREPDERLFYRGRWYEGLYLHAGADRADRDQLARFRAAIDRWVAWRDPSGRRGFALPASAASDHPEVTALDRVSFATWLDGQQLTSPRLRWLADYACRDDYGLVAADTSAWAGVAYFASRLVRPGADHQPVVTWPEGNGWLVERLAAGLGQRLHLGTAAAQVRPGRDGGVEVLCHGPDGARGWRARRAIVAVPTMIARRIVTPLRDGARPAPAVDRGAWAVANLHLRGRPRGRDGDAAPAWDNVLYDSPSLGYVVATHQRGRDHGPTVWTWYYPFTGQGGEARRRLDGASRADWASVALADLSRAHPDLPALCRRIDVCYWGHGMPRPRPGTVFDPALIASRAPLGPIHFAVSELSGLALFEEALDHGVRAATEVADALGRAR